jgi:hypothetical protein
MSRGRIFSMGNAVESTQRRKGAETQPEKTESWPDRIIENRPPVFLSA